MIVFGWCIIVFLMLLVVSFAVHFTMITRIWIKRKHENLYDLHPERWKELEDTHKR